MSVTKCINNSTIPETNIITKPTKSNNVNNNESLFENTDLTKIENMNAYLKMYNPAFSENFELTQYIDSGSTGIVYKGRSIPGKNNQYYSFKFCINKKNKKHSGNKYHEIIYQKVLHHINITQILAFYKINDYSFFSVSELGKFGNIDNFLRNFLKRSYLSETFVNYLAKPLLEALHYMHKKKLYHMDVKKGNIVLDYELNPKLIDFSSTSSFEKMEPQTIVQYYKIGTGRYMPPEVINKTDIEVKYGDKIDLYCLGITLFNLAFGSYPYGLNKVKGDDYNKIAEKLKNGKLEFPAGFEVSNLFKDFLKNILELDIYKRYSIRDALDHPWIKGWDIIAQEKEDTGLQENFIIRLISDNIPQFNEYIKN